MAVLKSVTVRVSDKSGEEIPADTGARVRVMFYGEGVDMRADLTDAEVADLIKRYKLTEVETRPTRAGEKRRR